MTESVAIFDVDHTLTRRSTGWHFAVAAARRGAVPLRRLVAIPRFYLSYRYGRMEAGDLEDDSRAALAGLSRALLDSIAEEAFESRILPDLRPEAVELVASLKREGRRIVLATSSFDLVVRPLAERLGVDTLLASALEFKDGLTTGRFEGPLLLGEAKLAAVGIFAAREGIALGDCSFYSDSHHDLPLLRAAGRPVAANPDRRLAREARARGWEIRDFA
ncbi:MAG: HAD family hydrolase [Spirochaetaceae bacterium]|nr:HAD family hydrolase [Spirochaetaceae bacterium]